MSVSSDVSHTVSISANLYISHSFPLFQNSLPPSLYFSLPPSLYFALCLPLFLTLPPFFSLSHSFSLSLLLSPDLLPNEKKHQGRGGIWIKEKKKWKKIDLNPLVGFREMARITSRCSSCNASYQKNGSNMTDRHKRCGMTRETNCQEILANVIILWIQTVPYLL